LVERLGINAFEASACLHYLQELYDQGVLGPKKEIETDLPFEEIGEVKFIDEFLHRLAYRVEIGDSLAEGLPRAAEQWGRLDKDFQTGIHPAMFWGYRRHYDTRTEVYWGYASIISGRDINCHDFNVPAFRISTPDSPEVYGWREPPISAEEVAAIVAEKSIPFHDPLMMDFSDENIYSIHMARTTAWIMYYGFFWKQSCGLCDNAYADFINPYGTKCRGITPEGEIRFLRAVTGLDLSFADTMELGRKIWNLNRVILVLQGRHRDMEKFPAYVYTVPRGGTYNMPTQEKGKWMFKNQANRFLDREGVEEWKTTYYQLEGWDPQTGWPTRKTLQDLGLNQAAEILERYGE
jgi:aldehyde:ferredoxin oxidoreductase